MIEKRVRLLPAREWLEHVDAMYLPVPIDKRLQVADWAFEPFLATVEDASLLTNDWFLLSPDDLLLTQGLHPSLTHTGGKKSDFFRQTGRDEAVVAVPDQEVTIDELAPISTSICIVWCSTGAIAAPGTKRCSRKHARAPAPSERVYSKRSSRAS